MKQLPVVKAAASLEEASVLDDTIVSVAEVVDRALPQGPVRELLNGEPLGHPLHPIAVLVPAGAWVSAAVLDLMPQTARASRALVALGVLCAVPAAAAGIADWSKLNRRQQRVGIVHWAANLAAVSLYSASYLQRRRGRNASGKLLGYLGLAVVSGSGYLGGHLAYSQGANVQKVPSGTAPE